MKLVESKSKKSIIEHLPEKVSLFTIIMVLILIFLKVVIL